MKDKSYSNIALSMVSKVIAVIAYFGVDILCARILPMKDYASWIYYTSIKTMLAYVAYFGLNTSTKVLVAQSANEEERLKCLRASIKIRTIINLVFAALLTIFSQFLAAKLDEYNRYSGFSDMFWAMGLLVLLESFFEFYKQISYGLNDYKMLVQVTGIEFGSNFILSFFFLEIQRDIFGVF
ncbi:MAG: oligosaccharide flippase family protein, partial [Lachnospiraceae bacterium]|nr:oligosaccharide flippase family protein [Lachnospiraceae bacterium]